MLWTVRSAIKPHMSVLYCIQGTGPWFNEGNISARSLRQIRKDYRKYRRLGKEKKLAKRYRNVVRKPVVDLEPAEQVAPP